MPKLEQSVRKGIEQYDGAMKRRLNTFQRRIATQNNIDIYFGQRMRAENWGIPGPVSKKDRGMVSGMIKLFKNNDYEDRKIFDFIYDLVHHWMVLRDIETVTLNGNKWVLGTRPNLRDICVCRESLQSNLLVVKRSEEHQLLIEKRSLCQNGPQAVPSGSECDSFNVPKSFVRRKKTNFVPSQREIDLEYQDLSNE